MFQVIKSTDRQKRKMYKALSKKQLIEMLIQANKMLDLYLIKPGSHEYTIKDVLVKRGN